MLDTSICQPQRSDARNLDTRRFRLGSHREGDGGGLEFRRGDESERRVTALRVVPEDVREEGDEAERRLRLVVMGRNNFVCGG